ncbi:MAG TPA: hypothetical protein VK569_05910, partial [Bacteroidota bacterium]|nr:hypothetical protein [Bacteroidota bacterium]
MIRPLNFRGFDEFDPLDFVSAVPRALLAIVTTAIVSTVLVWVITAGLHVVTFISTWVEVAEIAGFALIAAPLVLWLRKSSSLVLYLVILIPLFLSDLYQQAQFRDCGLRALWEYSEGTVISSISILPLRFFVTISVDALLIGPLCLWLARLLANMFYDRESAAKAPTTAQRDSLFPEQWTLERVGRPERDAGYWILRLLGFSYVAYLLLLALGALGSSPWPDQVRFLMDMTYGNPVFGVSTFTKITFMVLLAFIGAYNVRIRWYAALSLAIGHGVSTAGSLFFYFRGQSGPLYTGFLLTSAIVDGVMIVL